jgi:hypothetical protein
MDFFPFFRSPSSKIHHHFPHHGSLTLPKSTNKFVVCDVVVLCQLYQIGRLHCLAMKMSESQLYWPIWTWNASHHPRGKGVVCLGNWSNLSHVPSNAFDLMYTDYLMSLLDPLTLHPNNGYTQYNQLCNDLDNTKDWMCKTLNNDMQQRHEDWFDKWDGKMACISKPGEPVIVVQVSLPYCCLARHD